MDRRLNKRIHSLLQQTGPLVAGDIRDKLNDPPLGFDVSLRKVVDGLSVLVKEGMVEIHLGPADDVLFAMKSGQA